MPANTPLSKIVIGSTLLLASTTTVGAPLTENAAAPTQTAGPGAANPADPANTAAPASPAPSAAPSSPPSAVAPTSPPAAVVTVAAPTPVPSANDEEANDEEEASDGSGSFIVGPALFDVSSLNKHLGANGYEKLDSLMAIIGGEGHAVFPSGFVAGAHGGAILGPSGASPSDMQTHLSGGFGMADFGFAFVHSGHVLFTLTGGIGGYGLDLGIGDGRSVRFDDVLANPRRSTSMGHGGVLVGLTTGIDWRIPVGRVKRGRRGFFTLGLRLSGLYGPPLGGWSLAGGDSATEGPNTSLAGGYAALAIGFGGGSMHAHAR